jgi:hypothetical protein
MHPRAKWIGGAAVVLFGCGAAPRSENGSFPAEPLATIASVESKLVIEVRTAPAQPPERGVAAVQLVVKDRNGILQDGLEVAATPWMPAMGHGASVQPTVASPGKGTYLLDDVYLFMPGRWEIRTSFSGAVTDRATPAFDVP